MASQTHPVPLMTASQPVIERDLDNTFDPQATLLVAAIESFAVGLIIVAQDGTILHKNKRAQTLLKKISHSSEAVPDVLWRPCQSLIQSHDEQSDFFPGDCTIVLEDEIVAGRSTIHMRAQWFDWENSVYQSSDCFLITLEDREQSLATAAHQEAQRYKLTNRETDVWCLKRMGNSYREIASELFISENTVKKHLKNIYAKKEQSTVTVQSATV